MFYIESSLSGGGQKQNFQGKKYLTFHKQNVAVLHVCKVHKELSSPSLSPWAQGYKTFSMLNSAEHEILNAHKFKTIKKFSIYQAQISIEAIFPAHKG